MKKNCLLNLTIAPSLLLASSALADHVILDDCIIDGSMCVGLDCVNGEAFGFDTIRMKENNLRFHFDDTSTAASFPRNDWRFIANDSANGGQSYLAIEDSTGGRIPFRVVAGASANSIYVDAQGDVGLSTNNPVVELHIADGDTPTVRLEQNGTSGWNPQTWDVAGNETNFFIRDVTNGSKLPFRIRPDAPTNSINVAADGSIGFQTASPAGALHVENTSGDDIDDFVVTVDGAVGIGTAAPTARLAIPNDGATAYAIQVGNAFVSGAGVAPGLRRAALSNNSYFDGAAFTPNAVDAVGAMFQILDNQFFWHSTPAGVGVPALTQLARLESNGNMFLNGVMVMTSDRDKKADIEEVDTASVLEKVAELPISTWRYKTEDGVTHMGPMAQDFRAAFGLGHNETTLAPSDSAAIALASAKELYKRLQAKEDRIQELEARLERIEKALQQSAAK